MANKELREWKKKAHAAFDPHWKSKKWKRSYCYQLLAERMGIDPKLCHIGMFDIEECKKVIEITRRKL